jgi:MtrB/PioB family decaheme-associated outer membrane protein
MRKISTSFSLKLLSAAMISAFGSAAAAEDDIAQFTKPDSIISVGVGNWSGDRHQAGILDGMRKSGSHLGLDADVVKRDDATGTWFMFKGQNLGLPTRELRLDLLRQGDIGGYVEYSKIPYDNPFTFNTPLQGIGTQSLVVGNTTGGTFASREVKIGLERERWTLGVFKNLMPNVDVKFDYKHEDKTGTRQAGGGSAGLFSVEPFDSTIRQFDAVLRYTGKELQLSGGYNASWYDNHISLVMQQLNGITGGTSASFNSVTPISVPLSNQAHQLFLDGDYAFSPTTHGTFKLSYGRATQNERLPTYDLTGANIRFVNAPDRVNGKIDTTLVQLGLTAKPTPKLSLTASLRYNDVKDKTPVAGYVGSNVTGVATVWNTPHSYTTTVGKLEAAYRLPENFKLTGGVDYSTQDRSYPQIGTMYVPFRGEVHETTYRVALRRSLADELNGTVSFLKSDRNGSQYISATGTLPWSNQINPLHIADRTRDKLRFALDWAPVDKLDVQFRLDDSRDKYPDADRPYGLKDGSATLYAVDASYTLPNDWKLSTWYSNDTTKAREISFRSAGTGAANAVKESHLKDVGDSLGINLRGMVTAKLQMGLGLDWYKTVSRYPQDLALQGAGNPYVTGTEGPLPDVNTSMIRFKLDGKYELDKVSSLGFDFIHERWRSNDWTWNFANGSPFTYFSGNITCTGCSVTPVNVVDGTTITRKSTQVANFIGIRYNYKFQ